MSRLQLRMVVWSLCGAGLWFVPLQMVSAQTTKLAPAETGDAYFQSTQPDSQTIRQLIPKSDLNRPIQPPSQPQLHAADIPRQAETVPDAGGQPLKPMLEPLARVEPSPSTSPPTSAPPLEQKKLVQANAIDPGVIKRLNLDGKNSNPPATALEKSPDAPLFGRDIVPLNLTIPPATESAQSEPMLSQAEPASEAPPAEVFEPGRVLALVGGRPILVGDMLQEINELIEQHLQRAPEVQKQAQRQLLVTRMLPKFVDRQLIYVDSIRELPEGADIEKINESLGKSFDEEALPKYLEKAGAPSAAQFDAQLRLGGSSLRQFRQSWIEDQFVRYSLSQKMQAEEEVSYQEIKDYYDQHLSEYQFPARARWEQLVIRFDRVPDRIKAGQLIAEMGNEVVYGAALDAVAKKSSHDFKANEGGQQGWISQGSHAQATLDEAIFQLPLNQLSDVIETPTGLHIIRVLERTPAGAKPFRDAQVEIKEKLSKEKQERRFGEYLAKLRREIPIEVVDQSIQLPDQYLVR